ncbi:MAG: methyltransferase domain-containing protein [Myxococcales bacterium]|nr:methyltransferase domain-containing protein [Myxococcales bacterium]
MSIFWRTVRPLGFVTGLYDRLIPSAYHHALERMVEAVELDPGFRVVDVGCRTGCLIDPLRGPLGRLRGHYTGVDANTAALRRARQRSYDAALADYTTLVEGSITRALPLPSASQDGAFAHFTFYKIPDASERSQCLREMHRVVKPGGFVALLDPGPEHTGRAVVDETRELRDRAIYVDAREQWFEERILLPFILRFEDGLSRQIAKGAYASRTPEAVRAELLAAGFEITGAEDLYGGGSHLVIGRKPGEGQAS